VLVSTDIPRDQIKFTGESIGQGVSLYVPIVAFRSASMGRMWRSGTILKTDEIFSCENSKLFNARVMVAILVIIAYERVIAIIRE
jgi:hypothetical protein